MALVTQLLITMTHFGFAKCSDQCFCRLSDPLESFTCELINAFYLCQHVCLTVATLLEICNVDKKYSLISSIFDDDRVITISSQATASATKADQESMRESIKNHTYKLNRQWRWYQ